MVKKLEISPAWTLELAEGALQAAGFEFVRSEDLWVRFYEDQVDLRMSGEVVRDNPWLTGEVALLMIWDRMVADRLAAEMGGAP